MSKIIFLIKIWSKTSLKMQNYHILDFFNEFKLIILWEKIWNELKSE